jgi:hypothetical protein
MPLPQPVQPSYEEFIDLLAYMLATNANTSEVLWIVGEVGMGAPKQTPFAYIAPRNDKIPWETANGSTGGLPTGPAGFDMHQLLVPITVAIEPHKYLQPAVATPPAASPVSAQSLGQTPPFFEQPGYRAAMGIQRRINQALREDITVGGEVATTNIVETTYVLQTIEGDIYRALRLTLMAQQRRRRGT